MYLWIMPCAVGLPRAAAPTKELGPLAGQKPSPRTGNSGFALPVAEEAKPEFPQRSKIPRISASPTGFSGTARRTGGPLCVPCGYAADEVPAQRIMDSIGSGLVGRGITPLPHFNDPSCPLLSVFNIKIPVSTKRFYRLIFTRDRLFFTIEQKQFCIQSAMLIIYLTNEGACLTFKPV